MKKMRAAIQRTKTSIFVPPVSLKGKLHTCLNVLNLLLEKTSTEALLNFSDVHSKGIF